MKLLEYADARPPVGTPSGDDFAGKWSEDEKNKAKGYLPAKGLIDAINVALILGQPLLLTGEPGTGKTQFAYYVSWKLKRDPPLIFETKSTSLARDLFYTYDTLGRFNATRSGQNPPQPEDARAEARAFITYNALGIAVLRANKKDNVAEFVPEDSGVFDEGEERPSVVLIDEIDKAPRDFPNDLLNEVENMYFRVPELGVTGNSKIRVPEGGERPVLILTSNSEKHLPDAFLRRCVYYHIPFPDNTVLKNIVLSRMGSLKGVDEWLDEALALFAEVRGLDTRLDKKPATAELLGWLKSLHRMLEVKGNGRPLREQREIVQSTLSTTLLKSYNDQKTVESFLDKRLGKI